MNTREDDDSEPCGAGREKKIVQNLSAAKPSILDGIALKVILVPWSPRKHFLAWQTFLIQPIMFPVSDGVISLIAKKIPPVSVLPSGAL